MPAIAQRRSAFLSDGIASASPQALLVMLYDRLVLDLTRAEVALGVGDRAAANTQLLHAQAIVRQLSDSLDVGDWAAGPQLRSIYQFLISEMVAANVSRDAHRVVTCRELVTPLRDAWRACAQGATGTPSGAETIPLPVAPVLGGFA